ncbi:cardiotrophin-1 [Amia ocellicauda]|uniref:cardiotrophin-1 n=1 Tax=Amia ocellicauda TaxID=2972642 RepID=UPI0034639D6C
MDIMQADRQDTIKNSQRLTCLLLSRCKDLLEEYCFRQGFEFENVNPRPLTCPEPAAEQRPKCPSERLQETAAALRTLVRRLQEVKRWQTDLNPDAHKLHELLEDVIYKLGDLCANLEMVRSSAKLHQYPCAQETPPHTVFDRKMVGLSVCQGCLDWLQVAKTDLDDWSCVNV